MSISFWILNEQMAAAGAAGGMNTAQQGNMQQTYNLLNQVIQGMANKNLAAKFKLLLNPMMQPILAPWSQQVAARGYKPDTANDINTLTKLTTSSQFLNLASKVQQLATAQQPGQQTQQPGQPQTPALPQPQIMPVQQAPPAVQ